MMHTLHPTNVLRRILSNEPKGPNLAYTLKGLTERNPPSYSNQWKSSGKSPLKSPGKSSWKSSWNLLWKESLSKDTRGHRRERSTVAQWDGFQLEGLVSARMRNGHRAWEIDRLFITEDQTHPLINQDQARPSINQDQAHASINQDQARPSINQDQAHPSIYGMTQAKDATKTLLENFDQIVRQVGALGAQRLFLRIPFDSPIFPLAQRSGFFPYYDESIFERPIRQERFDPLDTAEGWQRLLAEDEYSLFQLFCAATPQTVRTAVGLTFDQWRDAQEPDGCQQNWVCKRNDRVAGWLNFAQWGKGSLAKVLGHPDHPEIWDNLLDWAQQLQWGPQNWLVPDYQVAVTDSLLRRQFSETARYTVMIKTVAVPAAKFGAATVEA